MPTGVANESHPKPRPTVFTNHETAFFRNTAFSRTAAFHPSRLRATAAPPSGVLRVTKHETRPLRFTGRQTFLSGVNQSSSNGFH